MIFQYSYETILGSVTFVEEHGALLAITTHRAYEGKRLETSLIKEAYKQLSEYLIGERKSFDLPLKPRELTFFTEERRVIDCEQHTHCRLINMDWR